jgi:hypothetical protein
MARASSCNSGVVTIVSGAPTPSLLGEGRSEPPPLLESMWNSSVEYSIMAHRGDSGLLRVETMKVVPKLRLLGERLKPPKFHRGRSHRTSNTHRRRRR